MRKIALLLFLVIICSFALSACAANPGIEKLPIPDKITTPDEITAPDEITIPESIPDDDDFFKEGEIEDDFDSIA